MGPGGESGPATQGDDLSLVNALAAMDQNARKVQVERFVSPGVPDFHFTAATTTPTGKNDGSVAHGLHFAAHGSAIVNTKMGPVTLEDGMKTVIAEARSDASCKP